MINAILIGQPLGKVQSVLVADDEAEQGLKENRALTGRERNRPVQFEEKQGRGGEPPPSQALRDKFRHWSARRFAASHNGASIACLGI